MLSKPLRLADKTHGLSRLPKSLLPEAESFSEDLEAPRAVGGSFFRVKKTVALVRGVRFAGVSWVVCLIYCLKYIFFWLGGKGSCGRCFFFVVSSCFGSCSFVFNVFFVSFFKGLFFLGDSDRMCIMFG